MSRPIRARGLKRRGRNQSPSHHAVAPHTGAWIETNPQYFLATKFKVAPHTGAWIETRIQKP